MSSNLDVSAGSKVDSEHSALTHLRNTARTMPTGSVADFVKGGLGKTDIIPLWFGEGDLPTPGFICDAATRALDEGHTFYTHQGGIPELQETLADYMRDLYGKEIGVERITITAGAIGAILCSLEAILSPGDNIIKLEPAWPNIRGAVHILGGETRSVRLSYEDNDWKLDMESLIASIDDRTRVIFCVSPSNPTAWTMPKEQLQQLLNLSREKGIWLIMDEVYARFNYQKRAADSVLELAEPEDLVLVINSFSKAWCMTGWRIGWLTHPASCSENFRTMMQYNSGGVSTFIQHAAITAIKEGESFVREVVERCRLGRDIVCDALEGLARIPGVRRPDGGMYVYFQVDGMEDSFAACSDIIERTGVGLAPGGAFGDPDFLRICCFNSEERIRIAMERLLPVFS